jgi:hypothetical protein
MRTTTTAMSDSYPTSCRRCKRELCPADFLQDRAMMLLGRGYCIPCLKQITPKCHYCARTLHQADFTEGRAVSLNGQKVCEGCMEHAVRDASLPEPKPMPAPDHREGADRESRRSCARFVPPPDCTLTVKPRGLRGLISGNAVVLWVDVSEGGLRAVLHGAFKPGDSVEGKMAHPTLDKKISFEAQVRHARSSEKYPGCTLAGLKFVEPSALLVAFIREVLGRNPSVFSLKPPTPKSPFPPARSA